mmetsp:Transcript_14897/g.32304  ORF Transcript_14897/g.32304 Transcript_14897/m.32304 type:complete len:289 (+) Transcript_14897:242-1108(+)
MIHISSTPSALTNATLFSCTMMQEHNTSKQFCINSCSSDVCGSRLLYSATHCSRVSMPLVSPILRLITSFPCARMASSSEACSLLLSNSRGRMRASSHLRARVLPTRASASPGSTSTRFSKMERQLKTALASSSTCSLRLLSLCTSSSRALASTMASTSPLASSAYSSTASESVSSRKSSITSAAMSVFSCMRQASRVGTTFISTTMGYSSGLLATCSRLLTCSSRSTSLSMNFSGASAYFMRCSRFSLYLLSNARMSLLRPLASSSWISSTLACSSACFSSSSGFRA